VVAIGRAHEWNVSTHQVTDHLP